MRIFVQFLLIVVLLFSTGVVIYRVVYDFNLIRHGKVFVVEKTSPDGYDYLLYIPRGYNDFSGPQPLLIFLHGAGEVGTDPNTLREKNPAFFAKDIFKNQETANFPFIVVVPISPEIRWKSHRVIALLDQVIAENRFRFRVDPDRGYLTGYSMGGFGTFETAMEFPERFAAIVPVAGGGESSKAVKLQYIPTWVFHGEHDSTVPLPSSALVVETMIQHGHRDAQVTVISRAGHVIAQQVYSNSELYRWLLSKRRGSLDNSTGSDASNFIDGRLTSEGFADPVVTEELHTE
jgi:predicted peptidase